MEIQKFTSAIEQNGYSASGITGSNRDEDAAVLAERNGISIEEAKSILKAAEEKAEENNRLAMQEAALMADLLNDQDEEEEIEIVDDADFDNFLHDQSGEEKMQSILNQQQFAKNDNQSTGDNPFAPNDNDFSINDDNPFLKMKW